MKIEDLLQAQAQYVQQQYADFEAMKRIYEREKGGDADAFSSFSPAPVSKKRSKAPEESYTEQGYADMKGSVSDWSSYMDKYASGEAFEMHKEAFPASLVLCEDEIEPDEMASGMLMGIPKAVWVHLPMGGRIFPDIQLPMESVPQDLAGLKYTGEEDLPWDGNI